MNAVQRLMNEHRLIERTIAALAAYAEAVADGADHPREDLAKMVSFIRDFADRHHHGKEEDILFQAMAEQGMPTHGGPLAVMLAEHEQGRGYTQALAALAEGEGKWTAADREELRRAATAYGQLLLAHIQKEDQVLYPMAQNMLSPETWKEIESAFTAFEALPANAQRARESERSVEALASRYGTE